MNTTTILNVIISPFYLNYGEAMAHMDGQGVTHLGWLNDGISVPEGEFQKVFCSYSGASCLYCDVVKRISYSVDMS